MGRLLQILVPRFRCLDQEMEKRDRFYRLSSQERQDLQLQRLNEAWGVAVQGSKYYSEQLRRLKLPPRFSSLEEFRQLVPRTSKEAVRAAPEAFKIPGHQRGKWMLTGGSTGSPTKVFWKLEGHLESLRDQYWARTWWGVFPFERQAMLWGHSHSFGTGFKGFYHKITIPLIDQLRGRRRFSAYHMGPEALRRYYDEMAAFRPCSLYAYASAGHLLACANYGRPPLPKPLKAAFLAAEPILESYRQSIRQVFGCPAVGEYGSIECGMIAYEHPTDGYRVFQHSVLVETEKDQSGYQILVTQLRDTAFPLFRYEIGDISLDPLKTSSEGFEILRNIEGRSHELIRTPSGNIFHGEMITHIMEQIPEVVIFNVHQDGQLRLHFQIVTKDCEILPASRLEWIRREIYKAIGEKLDIFIAIVPELERTHAGKHRWITSDVNQ